MTDAESFASNWDDFMRYPIAIHKDENSCYGVSVPDIPGCFSAGETYDEALNNVKEAISSHLGILTANGETIPQATNIEQWQNVPNYKDAAWALVEFECGIRR